jgi:hypothetical protein
MMDDKTLKLKCIYSVIHLRVLWNDMIVFKASFNNISVISWRSVLLVEETGVARENH